jgi:hypothetical protein
MTVDQKIRKDLTLRAAVESKKRPEKVIYIPRLFFEDPGLRMLNGKVHIMKMHEDTGSKHWQKAKEDVELGITSRHTGIPGNPYRHRRVRRASMSFAIALKVEICHQ